MKPSILITAPKFTGRHNSIELRRIVHEDKTKFEFSVADSQYRLWLVQFRYIRVRLDQITFYYLLPETKSSFTKNVLPHF